MNMLLCASKALCIVASVGWHHHPTGAIFYEVFYMEEIWKDIVGYEGRYMVSNLGRVKSKISGEDKILQLLKDNHYYFVRLRKDGNAKNFRVHKLVAKAFIDNPNNYPVVNHINWDKLDNRVDNLEWCTYSYNNWYLPDTKTNYEDVLRRKNRSKKKCTYVKRKSERKDFKPRRVLCVETGKTYDSISSAARDSGVEQSNISRALNGRQKTSGGFHWKYDDDGAYTVREEFRLNSKNDSDLIMWLSRFSLDPDGKDDYIKRLIREDMNK